MYIFLCSSLNNLYKEYLRRNKAWEENEVRKTNIARKDWYSDNPFFIDKDAYDRFAKEMLASADDGDLPNCFEHQEPENLTVQDFMLFAQRFQQDTGLSVEFRLITCSHCDRLHCLIIVDENERED